MSASAPLVVEADRSGLVESTHLVDVAVTDGKGKLVAWAGDAGTVAYLRSSAKPIQAAACLGAGWEPQSVEQVAIACGSHNAEEAHLETVRGTLAAAGLTESALRCPASWPLYPELVPHANAPARIQHNCSGKHAAMLAACVVTGWPLDDYRSVDHPVQRAIALQMSGLAGRDPRNVGIDGCGVPTFAFTLLESAAMFGALASSEGGARAVAAMRAHPFLVAGSGRLCTALMESVPGVVVKAGAEGLLCGLHAEREIAFALKPRDGVARARDAVAVSILRELEVIRDGDLPASLSPGIVTGLPDPALSITVRGGLQRA